MEHFMKACQLEGMPTKIQVGSPNPGRLHLLIENLFPNASPNYEGVETWIC